MGRAQLIKRSGGSGTTLATQKISVEDTKGNALILKATVVGISNKVEKTESYSLVDDELEVSGLSPQIIPPPLSQEELACLAEFSTELGQTIEAMSIGIDGFGGRLFQKKMSKELETQHKQTIDEEHLFLSNLFEYPNPDDSFAELRRNTRSVREQTGNAYWELVAHPMFENRFSCVNLLDSMRITRADRSFTKMWLNFVKPDFTMGQKFFMKRFRRFVQIVGGKKVFFKEFCDPRIIDRRTGEVADEKLPKELRANEVYHFKIKPCRQTPYGMPRFTGNIISVRGSRQADETNLITLMNNNIPSFAILANGAMLTQGSIERIREFVQSQMAGSSNFSKWLILEGESTHDGLSSPGNAKIEIVPLTKAQHSDMLFQNYDENNAKKLRRNFRIAPILVGASENYDRATAQVSERLTEKYVFNPEREAEDRIINKILLRQGIRFWNFKSNSPNVTNDEDLVHILTGAERSGALTPRISRLLLEDILNRELPGFENMPADFNPDVPFSYTLAKLMHSVGSSNQNGTFAPQGQMPKSSDILGLNSETLFTEIFKNPNQYLQSLLELRGHLKLGLEKEAFGEAAGGSDGKQCC
jgi:PBSX family phage portal protein